MGQVGKKIETQPYPNQNVEFNRHVILSEYYWYIPPQESKAIAESHFDKIITALITPLTPEEIDPPQDAKVALPPIKISAENYDKVE